MQSDLFKPIRTQKHILSPCFSPLSLESHPQTGERARKQLAFNTRILTCVPSSKEGEEISPAIDSNFNSYQFKSSQGS